MIPNKKIKILVVGDLESIRLLLHLYWPAKNGRSCWRREGGTPLGCFGANGLDVLKEIRAMDPSAKVIVYSGTGGGTLEEQARALGASDFVTKGGSLRPLWKALNPVA